MAALLLQTAPYVPVKKEMDPSKSKSNITFSTVIETNNKLDPSSSNKNVIVKLPKTTSTTTATATTTATTATTTDATSTQNTEINTVTDTQTAQTNAPKAVKTTTPKPKSNTNTNSTKYSKIDKPKIKTAQNVTLSVKKEKKPSNGNTTVTVVLDANGVEVPKLSRRLKIQEKVEKQRLKAEADGVEYIPPVKNTPSSPSASSPSNSNSQNNQKAVKVEKKDKVEMKADSNSKANRPPANRVEGPNSGRKWVRREEGVAAVPAMVGADSSLLAAPVGEWFYQHQATIIGSYVEAIGCTKCTIRYISHILLLLLFL